MFNCSCCKYTSNKKYNLTRHVLSNHKKNKISNDNVNIKCDEYIYLFQEREFIKTNEPIYKIGKTKQPCLTRLKNYPNGTLLLFQIKCNDCDKYEKLLISIFKEKFIQIKNLGYEYFMGNYFEMIVIIYDLIWNEDIKNGINDNDKIYNKNAITDNKCSKCNKILSSKQYLEKHLLICKGVLNPLECYLCHKILANRGSKSTHLKKCKGILINEPSTELTNNNTIINNTVINNNINNGVINNTSNITNIIIFDPLKPYGTTLKTDHINLEFISKLLKIKEKDALTLYTKKLLDNPENRCIKKTNLRSIYSQIHIGDNKWDCCYDNDIYPKFISEISNCLRKLLLSQNLNIEVINKLIEFIDYMAEDGYCNDDDKCDEIKRQYKEQIKKTKIIIYNLRDLMKD